MNDQTGYLKVAGLFFCEAQHGTKACAGERGLRTRGCSAEQGGRSPTSNTKWPIWSGGHVSPAPRPLASMSVPHDARSAPCARRFRLRTHAQT